MKYSALLLPFMGLGAMAFPRAIMEALAADGSLDALTKRQLQSTPAAVAASKARGNCGVVPCLVFDPVDQYVSTSAPYDWQAPKQGQVRGPCPGLNAAANHGYIPRSGFLGIADTVTGLGLAYNMSPDLAGFLAAYAIFYDGDPVTMQWSIGGHLPYDAATAGILGEGNGISCSHNNYEGDSSLSRADAYINGGDAHSLIISRFTETYTKRGPLYTLDSFVQDFQYKADQSVANNPYYFSAPFSGLVAPAAYQFVINFMSNHTAANPNGYLNGDMFKTFFAVTGSPGNFQWQKGQERIPDNWYKRTTTNQYNAINVFMDLAVGFAAYPDTFRLGGNTRGTNSYAGVSLTDFTGGVYNLAALADPSGCNGACFYSQIAQSLTPDFAKVSNPVANGLKALLPYFKAIVPAACTCKPVSKYDYTYFGKYPGAKYQQAQCPDLTYKE